MLFIDMRNKYMKDYEKNKESSYIKYWDVNNLHGSVMSQKMSIDGFGWVEIYLNLKDFLKNYNEDSYEGYS